MADRAQFEIQLGHLCNNRCVFCISGRLTSQGDAPLLDADMLARRIAEAHADGHRKITFLGGEPTIQPFFLDLVRHAVALGFEDVVVFSNGSRLWSSALVDEVLATGGRFEFRFSFQGATKEAHERTTRRQGSFDQLLASVEAVRARGQRVTINTCVVTTNFASLDRFAELLVPRGVRQLHVDMLNPYDVGVMPADELTSIMPRLSDLAGPIERMVRAFPADFDVNVGNLPQCIAPSIASVIHHGGEPTRTVTADDFGVESLQLARDKYAAKQARKVKPDRCRSCVFDDRCGGVFEAYAERFGLDELQPITDERLAARSDQSFDALRPTVAARLARLRARAPFGSLRWRDVRAMDDGARVEATFEVGDERAIVWLEEKSGRASGGYRVQSATPSTALIEGVRAIMAALGKLPTLDAPIDQPR